MNPIDLLIWGATGQATVLAELINQDQYRICVLVDRAPICALIADVPLLKDESSVQKWLANRPSDSPLAGAIAIGGANGAERQRLQIFLNKNRVATPNLIHQRAFVASTAMLGDGCQVLAGASVCAGVRMGSSVIVNTNASVDHGTVVGDGAHIGPGATVTGDVQIGANVFVGAGATILPRLSIGSNSIIGAGAVVTRSLPSNSVAVGNPARLLKARER